MLCRDNFRAHPDAQKLLEKANTSRGNHVIYKSGKDSCTATFEQNSTSPVSPIVHQVT